jgi:hypothetical protein
LIPATDFGREAGIHFDRDSLDRARAAGTVEEVDTCTQGDADCGSGRAALMAARQVYRDADRRFPQHRVIPRYRPL